MAATLAHIKSKMLLPAPPPGQEDERARRGRRGSARGAHPAPARVPEVQAGRRPSSPRAASPAATCSSAACRSRRRSHRASPPLAEVPLFSLVEAFQSVLAKSKVKLSHDIVARAHHAHRSHQRARRHAARAPPASQFEELFDGADRRRFDLVITFLALLEMTKLRMTRLVPVRSARAIYVEFSAQVTRRRRPERDASTDESAPRPTSAQPPRRDANAARACARATRTKPHAQLPPSPSESDRGDCRARGRHVTKRKKTGGGASARGTSRTTA